MHKPLIIIGAGGHGKVILDAAIKAGFTVAGFLDDALEKDILGFCSLGMVSDINKFADSHVFVCAIGENSVRLKLDISNMVEWATIIHPAAHIGLDVVIGNGTVVMAGAVVNVAAQIGRHCIVNTGAIIEHDCTVLDYAHISPKAVICGGVKVGEGAWIGAGAVIKDGISICADAIVGAGAVVLKDITKKGTYIGVPARLR